MLNFFKLIRLPNLLIMAFTQYMVRWCLLIPTLDQRQAQTEFSMFGQTQMSEFDFFLLVLSTVLIGGAGYIINDYFDVRIDEVNRPATNLIGKTIKRRVAMAAHMTLNILGSGLGILLSYKYSHLENHQLPQLFRLGLIIYISAPALLWFYSTNLKRQFLIGNIIIALLSAVVPLIVILFELPLIHRAYPQIASSIYFNLNSVMYASLALALFAFIITLLREIIKDTEDYEGDLVYGCKTLPIVLGIAPTKWVMTFLCFIVIAIIGWIQYGELNPVVTIPVQVKQGVQGIPVSLIDTLSGKAYSGFTDPTGTAMIDVPGNAILKTQIEGLSPRIFHSTETSVNWKTVLYFLFLLQLPLIYLTWRIQTAKGKSDWRFASLLTKIIMVAGVSYLFLYAYGIYQLIELNA